MFELERARNPILVRRQEGEGQEGEGQEGEGQEGERRGE